MSQASMIWMERKVVALDLTRKKRFKQRRSFQFWEYCQSRTVIVQSAPTWSAQSSWWCREENDLWLQILFEWLSREGKILGLQHENQALGWWNYLYLVNLKSSVSPHHQQPSMIVQMTPYGSVRSARARLAEPSLKCRSLLSCSTPSSQTLLTFTADFTSLIQIQPR